MKKMYVTITGMNHYYGLTPFSVGKKLKCVKDKKNPFDSEAIRVELKGVGVVGYIANTPYTKATGTMSAGGIRPYVKKKFIVKVMFITSSKVICQVIDGFKDLETSILTPPEIEIKRTDSEEVREEL